MKGKAEKRLTLRYPKLVKAFALRFRHALVESGCRQGKLAEQIGGFRQETISRLSTGQNTAVPLDMMVRIADWAASQGFSLHWLFTGKGEMRPETQRTEDALAASIKQIVREAVREELKNKESEK